MAIATGFSRIHRPQSGVIAFFVFGIAYALGMGSMIIVLSAAVGASRELMIKRFRFATRYFQRIAGVVIVLSASYVIYYQIFIGQVLWL